jgi:arylsulfatase A-like enzyme
MEELAYARAVRVPRARRILRPGQEPDRPILAAAPAPAGLILSMCWFGLVAGLLELSVVLAQRELIERISLESLRTNRHFLWMIPTADLLIFGLCGVFLAWLSKRRPGVAQALVYLTGSGLLVLSSLMALEGIHPIARIVLTCAVAYRALPLLKAHSLLVWGIVKRTLPALGGGLIVLIALVSYTVISAERRNLAQLPAGTPSSPNVLLIVLDDVRADSMSLHGHTRPTTPRLEALAHSGVRFDSARSPAPWTLPSHASMFTGQWPHRLSVGFDRGLDATFPTLAEFLATEGYATAGFVANTYYCNARYGLDRGFARYEDFRENLVVSPFEVLRSSSLGKRFLGLLGYPVGFAPGAKGSRKTAADLNRDALEWLGHRPEGRPFFLFLNYYDAHGPFVPPDDASCRFGLAALPEQEQVQILKKLHMAGQLRDTPVTEDRAQIHQQGTRLLKDAYESCIAYLDDQIGRLFDELRSRGLLENTLVIVTSDHGEHLQERGFSGHGLSLYKREIHVPLLIFPPASIPERRVVPEPVSLRELPATVVDLLSLPDRSPFPGQSLARFFQAGAEPIDSLVTPVLSEVEHQKIMPRNALIPATLGSLRALTTENDVYILNSNGYEELFDRATDPFESHDRIEAERDQPRTDQLRESLARLLGR